MNNRSTINGYRIHHDGNFNENIGILKNLTNGYEYYYPCGEGYFEIFNVDLEATSSGNSVGYNSLSKAVLRAFITVTTSADTRVKYGQIHIRIANHLTDSSTYRKEEITIENGLFSEDEIFAVRDESNLSNGIINYKVYLKARVSDDFIHLNISPITKYLYKAKQNNSERNYITELPNSYIKAVKNAPRVKYLAEFENDVTLRPGENVLVFNKVIQGDNVLQNEVRYTLEDNKIYLFELNLISYDAFNSLNDVYVTFWRVKKEDGNKTTYNKQNVLNPSINANATVITDESNQFSITLNCSELINVKAFSSLKIIELA